MRTPCRNCSEYTFPVDARLKWRNPKFMGKLGGRSRGKRIIVRRKEVLLLRHPKFMIWRTIVPKKKQKIPSGALLCSVCFVLVEEMVKESSTFVFVFPSFSFSRRHTEPSNEPESCIPE